MPIIRDTYSWLERRRIGEHIKRARKARNMTQKDLGKAINVSNGTIASIELAHRHACGEAIRSALEFFGITEEEAKQPINEHKEMTSVGRYTPRVKT